jgi:hypothetical protein
MFELYWFSNDGIQAVEMHTSLTLMIERMGFLRKTKGVYVAWYKTLQ